VGREIEEAPGAAGRRVTDAGLQTSQCIPGLRAGRALWYYGGKRGPGLRSKRGTRPFVTGPEGIENGAVPLHDEYHNLSWRI